MFNPEKLLGGLISSGTRRSSGIGGLLSGGAALGLVGVAMEAVEHFMNKPQGSQAGGSPPATPTGMTTYPSGPPPMAGSGTPPPPPSAGAGTTLPGPLPSPDLPETAGDARPEEQQNAVLLIRAMIAAANADGMIDEEERNKIIGKLSAVELSKEEHTFIFHELMAPADLDSIARQVSSEAMAEQIYTVSLLAIDVDTDAERDYMNQMVQRLGLNDAVIERIHNDLQIARF